MKHRPKSVSKENEKGAERTKEVKRKAKRKVIESSGKKK
jgi:hypothetical protein